MLTDITLDHFVSITFDKPRDMGIYRANWMSFAPGLISKDYPDIDLLWPHAVENPDRLCDGNGCRVTA